MLESNAGLHFLGLCCRRKLRFLKTDPSMYGETGSMKTDEELWK
jgi:hypothetical protein